MAPGQRYSLPQPFDLASQCAISLHRFTRAMPRGCRGEAGRGRIGSEAAERVFPDQAMLRAGLDQARQLLQQHLLRQWRSAKEEVDRLAVCRVLSQPMTPIREQAQRLDEWAERLDRAVSTQRERAEKEVSALAAQLQSLSPLNVLARGYSVTLDQEGQAIEAATELKVGQKITTRLRQGAVLSEVVSVAPPDSEWS